MHSGSTAERESSEIDNSFPPRFVLLPLTILTTSTHTNTRKLASVYGLLAIHTLCLARIAACDLLASSLRSKPSSNHDSLYEEGTMEHNEAERLVKQLTAGFETLQDEYQKLFGRHQVLERKLATAREQVSTPQLL